MGDLTQRSGTQSEPGRTAPASPGQVAFARENAPSSARINGLAWMLGVGFVWLWTWRHLSVEWRLNADYSHGFVVPLLAVFLAWQRLAESHLETPRVDTRSMRMFTALAIAGAAFFLLAELLRLQDPTWRFGGWLMMGAATLFLWSWLGHIGGFPWIRQLALPVAFNWLALPWPSAVEGPLTLSLLGLATSVSVHCLNWAGVAALQHGNLIELKTGIVGVDRACSGIQSLQASFVLALFLGEFFRLRLPRRFALLLLGVVAAVIVNILRVFVLAKLIHHHGQNAVDQYHDPVGAVATLCLVLFLAAAGKLLAGKPGIPAPEPRAARPRLRDLAMPGVKGFAVLGVAVLVPLGASAWMNRGAVHFAARQSAQWRLDPTALPAGWRAAGDPFEEAEIKLLRFSQGAALNVVGPNGEQAHVVHLFWTPDAAVPSQAYSHRPDICLPGAGWQEIGEPVETTVTVNGRAFPGVLFRFRHAYAERLVFHAVWYGGEPKPATGPIGSIGDRFGRFALLWKDPGRRSHEILTVFMPAQGTTEQDRARLETLLANLLRPVK